MLDSILAALGPGSTLLIDGRSGSGKSTLATGIARAHVDATVVRLDDIYPGWDGLDWARQHVGASLLEPRAHGKDGTWRSWDWISGTAGGWNTVRAGTVLIVEGVGSLTPRHRELADLAVWVEASDHERKSRALTRDGETYAPHWERWAAQEERFIRAHRPREAADLIAYAADGGFRIVPPGEIA